jgi:hypothetical protein
MRHIHCDKCKKEFEQPTAEALLCWRIEFRKQSTNPNHYYVTNESTLNYDLCEFCMDQVCNFIEGTI